MAGESMSDVLETALSQQIPYAPSMSDEEIEDEIEKLVDQNPLLVPDQTPLSLEEAFILGSQIEYLIQITELNAVLDDGEDRGVIGALEQMRDVLKYSKFDSAVKEQIEEEMGYLQNEYEQTDELSDEHATSLVEKANQWGQILETELDAEKRVPISNRGLFDVEAAMENPKELFDPDVWNWLPSLPKNDIIEACQCLAVESSTGSMMLSLRAVEDCLRRWYVNEMDDKTSVNGDNWNAVIKELEDRFGENTRQPAVLENLDYLRLKRNQVSHPDKVPSWSEAEATLFIVRNTIKEIHQQMTSGDEE